MKKAQNPPKRQDGLNDTSSISNYADNLQIQRIKQPDDMASKQFQDTAKTDAIIKIQNAIRNKKAIDEFSTKYGDKMIDAKTNKERQTEVFLKYIEMYKPNEDITSKGKRKYITFPKFSVEDERKRRQTRAYKKFNTLYTAQYIYDLHHFNYNL